MSTVKARVLEMAKEDLADIETALKKNLTPQLDLVARVSGHILFAGGKRLRPLLMVLCARLCGYAGEDIKAFSTIMEYLHAATLLHDDLVDGAAVRRENPQPIVVSAIPRPCWWGIFCWPGRFPLPLMPGASRSSKLWLTLRKTCPRERSGS